VELQRSTSCFRRRARGQFDDVEAADLGLVDLGHLQIRPEGQLLVHDRPPVLGARLLLEAPLGAPGVGLDPFGEVLAELDLRLRLGGPGVLAS
jgi:hypothetical protein